MAQEKLFRTATTETGKQVRLGMYGDPGKDCSAGTLPDIKVTTPPRHGTLDIQSGKTKAGRLKRCPNLEVPVQGVFYKPANAYKGNDEAVFEVKRADGKTQVLTYKVEVGGAKTPAKDDADL